MSLNRGFVLLGSLLALVILMGSSQTVSAAEVWKAEYWNNKDLEGNPVLVRNESGLDNDWGDGAPSIEVDNENFSARWSTRTAFNEGTYRFTSTVDDGMRVYIDGNKIIDVWYDSQQHDVVADYYMSSGEHNIVVEYYEAGGNAVAKLSWQQVGGGQNFNGNWTAQYYNSISLAGSPAVTQQENMINYVWGGSPVAGISADDFSVRWSGTLQLDAGTYRFTAAGDDGIRLWVNGQQIIDQWIEQPETSYSADIYLPGGAIPVTLEHYDRGGTAAAKLRWSQLSSVTITESQSSGSQTFSDWKGEYFNNINLSGTPVLVRNDKSVNFNWGSSSPFPNIVQDDLFSVRWSRSVVLNAGTYQFSTFSDDGVRLYVNDQLVLDKWTTSPGRVDGTVTIPGGQTDIRLEFFEMRGLSEIRLDWDEVNPAGTSSAASSVEITAPEGSAVIKNVRVLSVRSGPNLDSERVDFITRSTVVRLVGQHSGGFWIKVELPNGTIGWASSKYLSSPTPFGSLPVVE